MPFSLHLCCFDEFRLKPLKNDCHPLVSLLLLCLSDVGFRRPIKKGPIVYSTSLKYNKFVVNLCEIVFCLLKKTTSTYRIGNDIFMHAEGEFVYLMFVYVSCHETKAQQSNQTTWHGQLLKSITTSN